MERYESVFDDCCGGNPGIEATIKTETSTYIKEIITIHTLSSGQDFIPYTLYRNGVLYYSGKLVKSEESYTKEGCEVCYEMADYLRLIIQPGKYTLKVDDNQLCAASDGKGRLVFLDSDGNVVQEEINITNE